MQLRSVVRRIAPAVGVIGLFLVGATPAHAIVVGVNIDVHQDIIGAAPNDFHIEGRIESGTPDGTWSDPPVLIEHIDDMFPAFTYTIQPDLSDPAGNWYIVTADWSFPPGTPGIPYCSVLHLGLFFDVTCHNIIIDLIGWWTIDGQRIPIGMNFGTVPIVGFAVEDQPADGRQFIRIHNDSGGGGGGGIGEPIFLSVVDMDLVALSREELMGMLGREPFRELRAGGLQEQLPWVQVMQFGLPVSEMNPIPTWPDSFFDVFFDGQNSDLTPQVPIAVQPGAFLLSRQLMTFTGNDGNQEFRWYYEIHGAHEPPPPPPPPPPGVVAGFNVDIHQDIPLQPWPNDFHIEGRIESGTPGGNWSDPPTLVDQVNDRFPFWNVSITPDLSDPNQNWYLVTADWWGAEVPYCDILHLGLFFRVTCHNVVIDLVGWWTRDGLPLPNFPNQGQIPIAGFRVNDWINEPPVPSGQVIRIQNAGGVAADVVQMDLFPADRTTLEAMLGAAPFRELRLGGRQAMLPWIPVLHRNGMPISEFNPMSFDIDSFFDVFFEVPQAGEPTVDGPFSIPPGGFLLARELLRFRNNAGEVEWRWVWEMHGAHEQLFDLGDAPDSSNSWGSLMTAYPSGGPAGVLANFPTVFGAGSPPHGPLHRQPRALAYLGPQVTLEQEADIGPDQDPTNNLVPPNDLPDLDQADDGVGVPLTLPHCVPVTFNYTVTVVAPGPNLYVNVWFDWTRNGDWNETPACPGATPAPEWAVQNQTIFFLAPGTYTVTTPAFVPWHPNTGVVGEPIWMRVTLSHQWWDPTDYSFVGGAGPSQGYDFGETEDYYFVPQGTGPTLCPLPVTNPWCGNLQSRDCQSTAPIMETCLPRSVLFSGGLPQIETCDCFPIDPACGPVDLQPKLVGYTVSCPGTCPPGMACELHFNGAPIGQGAIDSSQIPDGTLVTCDCVVPQPPLCPVPAANPECSLLQWRDCQSTTGECLPKVIRHHIPGAQAFFPDAGEDVLIPTTGHVVMRSPDGSTGMYPIMPEYPPNTTRIIRESPTAVGLHREIAAEIVESRFVTMGPGGMLAYIRESPTRASAGRVVGSASGASDYPADSFFDLFVEIDIPEMQVFGLHNEAPIPMAAYGIDTMPPECDVAVCDAYQSPPGWQGVELLDASGMPTGFFIIEARHVPPEPAPEWEVIECACFGPNDCRVTRDLTAIPTCTGGCPAGQECVQRITSIDPSTVDYTCECVPLPTQACCLANGLCVDVLYDDCVAQGGDPNGPGTTCVTLPGGCTPLKWAQPPTFNSSSPHPECFWGWDDPSMYIAGPIVADDWLCTDERPVTDIHWWGSYPGWQGVTPPPDAGPLFHLGVWTDVPAGVDQPWSHPGIMVWQWTVPRDVLNERPVACDFHPAAMNEPDGCFRYDFTIPQAEWFFQGAATSQVYWLSIAAMGGACACNGDLNGDGATNVMDLTVLVACIQGGNCSGCVNSCDLNCDGSINPRDADTMSCLIAQNPPNVCCPDPAVPHRWGWKTRERNFNDDAVRIFVPSAPIIGAPFESGEPIGQPGGTRWDMAFVLTTEEALKEACCYYMTGLCADLGPADCVETGGTPDGPGTHCMGDLNANGVDDACETCIIAAAPKPEMILDAQGVLVPSVKNRFLSFAIAEPGIKAVRVKLVSLPGAFSTLNGQTFWVDTPRTSSELPSKTFTDPVGGEATFQSATLRTTPLYRDWSATGVVHVYDERIIPSRKRPGSPLEPAMYEIQAIMSTCDTFNEGDYSAPLAITNPRWGDLAALMAGQFLAPDGVVEVTSDVLGVLAKFSNAPGAPIKARAEMVGSGPSGPLPQLTGKIEIGDVLAVLNAFTGGEYPFPPPP